MIWIKDNFRIIYGFSSANNGYNYIKIITELHLFLEMFLLWINSSTSYSFCFHFLGLPVFFFFFCWNSCCKTYCGVIGCSVLHYLLSVWKPAATCSKNKSWWEKSCTGVRLHTASVKQVSAESSAACGCPVHILHHLGIRRCGAVCNKHKRMTIFWENVCFVSTSCSFFHMCWKLDKYWVSSYTVVSLIDIWQLPRKLYFTHMEVLGHQIQWENKPNFTWLTSDSRFDWLQESFTF